MGRVPEKNMGKEPIDKVTPKGTLKVTHAAAADSRDSRGLGDNLHECRHLQLYIPYTLYLYSSITFLVS